MSFGGVRLFANQKTCDVSAAQKGCENLDLVCIGVKLDECELDETKSLCVVLKTCDGYVRVCVNLGVAYRKSRTQKPTRQRPLLSIKRPAIAAIR